MSIPPSLQNLLNRPAAKPHADKFMKIMGEIPASRQAALVRYLESWSSINAQFQEPSVLVDSVLSASERWRAIVGPCSSETGMVLAMARFCHEHPHELSAWLVERNLDEHPIRSWVSRWIRGQEALEKLHQAACADDTGGAR